ncbi:MAG TPA: heme o synthase [Candidatus Saccharimonadales bacterium]|nr:heme o synthase [Candidatus Saccharimonadales bacterium]
MVGKYYSLTKPGVLYGNVITGVAGFLLGASYFRRFDVWLFVATIGGMTLVIASACVLNNVLDQDIDALMERTKKRAVAAGDIPARSAAIFSAVLGIAGIAILALWVSWLVVGIGAVGFVVYVWLYGALSKRRSVHGTLVGSISGAMPILAGYCAVSRQIDGAAILVFFALFFWQFPEFYSIAIYRRREYKAAGVPVISVVKGVTETKQWILGYTLAFVISTLLLTVFGYTGWIYFVVMALLGLWFIKLGLEGQTAKDSDKWARRMFHFSLIVIMIFSLMISIGPLLP